ncbi:hypothetical protein [Flavobacterium acetivorans]|uniref:hypothetical protein n=1 Tax=Flavobacterium acetivorans TaxID=2893883 RepID=UPI001E56F89D|nr:hypothetical protein [Flavobacterium sp. F-29]UFH35062.1 hypothetical protein LNP19_13355 [Flavobacterium sp. F-29]
MGKENKIKQIKKMTVMKKIDNNYLKKIKEIDTENEKIQFIKNDTFIELKDQGETYFESKRKSSESISNFIIYDKKNNLMIKSGTYFYNSPIGIYRKYNEKGEILEEINKDEGFSFSVYDLIEKIKLTHNVNLNDGKLDRSVHRGVDNKSGKLIHEINYDINVNKGDFKYIKIDAKTGEILSERKQQLL